MRDVRLDTWEGIKTLLDQLDLQHREPDPWEAHFRVQAIISLDHGKAAPEAVEAADCPLSARHAENITNDFDEAARKSDLRAAFLAVRVPGSHPA